MIELDALLLCDRKGAGQQLAAQAGKSSFATVSNPQHTHDYQATPSSASQLVWTRLVYLSVCHCSTLLGEKGRSFNGLVQLKTL